MLASDPPGELSSVSSSTAKNGLTNANVASPDFLPGRFALFLISLIRSVSGDSFVVSFITSFTSFTLSLLVSDLPDRRLASGEEAYTLGEGVIPAC